MKKVLIALLLLITTCTAFSVVPPVVIEKPVIISTVTTETSMGTKTVTLYSSNGKTYGIASMTRCGLTSEAMAYSVMSGMTMGLAFTHNQVATTSVYQNPNGTTWCARVVYWYPDVQP